VLNRDLWELLDQARLTGVPLVHVKGHSGDPDNDRCDVIAVAFSKGQMPALAAGAVDAKDSKVTLADQAPAAAPPSAADLAPAGLQQLLTRLELADRLAERGYGLNLVELAQLVEMPLKQLEGKTEAWAWRDWLVQPADGGRWRLARAAGGLGLRE
jgi:ribonuclease HI